MKQIIKKSFLFGMLMISPLLMAESLEEGIAEFNSENYPKAMEILLPYAHAGNSEAQADVAVMYSHGGEGLDKDISKSVEWFQKAADQGNHSAQFYLANMYLNGNGVDADIKKAEGLFTSAAKSGNPTIQATLALMYENGTQFEKNMLEAIRWYKACAENGSTFCQTYLGLMYKSGFMGVPQDDFESVKWYRMAADGGDASAQLALGEAYASGRGAPKNLLTAHMWFNLASAAGDISAFASRRMIERKLTQVQIVQAQKMAKNFRPKKLDKIEK